MNDEHKPEDAVSPEESAKTAESAKPVDPTRLNLEPLEASFPSEHPAPKEIDENSGNKEDEFEIRRKRFFGLKKILLDVLLGLLVLVLFSLTYVLSFNRTFNSWWEGRQTWREIAKFLNKHTA